ncbi:histidine phosphatase family protein [Undibacterium sp. Xuan67W]|uniref:histidine phosphatase family protein n=1 Tax=Undibacterium sp. Xuan67W TaxID=3413057 RepID=UPI003BF10AB7
MAQIYLVRHGQASFGNQNYDQLSELGKEQAQHLGRWWAARDLTVSRVVTGKLHRHIQTARAAIACLHGIAEDRLNVADWECDPDFNEYNHHEVLAKHVPAFDDPAEVKRFLLTTPNGKQAFQDIFAQAITRWMSGQFDHEYSETWTSFRQRCITALERQIHHPDTAKNIVIFTSGGTISAICQHVLGFPDAKFSELNWSLVNSAVTRLHLQPPSEGKPARLALAYLNNFSHLEQLNLPKHITYV